MRKVFALFLLALLISCSNKTEEVVIPVISEEEEEKVEEMPDEFEIRVDNEIYSISIHDVPAITYYLSSAKNWDEKVNEVKGTTIEERGNHRFILVEYACQKKTKKCSYVLVKENNQGISSVALRDLTTFDSYHFSPDDSHVIFHFKRDIGLEELTSHLQVVNIDKMEIVNLKNDDLDRDVLNYNYPITNIEWLENNTIQMEIPYYTESDEPIEQPSVTPETKYETIQFEI